MEGIIQFQGVSEQRTDMVQSLIVILDRDGKIISCNAHTLNILGYEAGEVQGKYWADLLEQFVREPYYSKVMKLHKEALDQYSIAPFEITIRTGNGKEHRLTWTITRLLNGEGEYSEILAIGQERTSGIADEEEPRRIDRIKALGALSSRIAHDLRNPLSGVLLNAQMLAEEVKQNPLMAEIINDILTGVQRIDQYLDRLLNFSRPAESEKRPFDIIHITNEALHIIRHRMTQSHIDIQIATEQDLPLAFADPDHIKQILVNLLMNSMEAMPGGGKIRIILRSIASAQEQKSIRNLELIIEDTGVGISKADIPKIFDPSFTTKSGGIGLGLSIVQALLLKNDGTIRVESMPGEMTRFTVHIPSV